MTKALPVIGYMGDLMSKYVAFRLRVYMPSQYMNLPFMFDRLGDITMVYRMAPHHYLSKDYNKLPPMVYDMTNDVLASARLRSRGMVYVNRARMITTCSELIQESIYKRVKRESVVIPDPYEHDEKPAFVNPEGTILWYGNEVHLPSLERYHTFPNLKILTNTVNEHPYMNVTHWSHALETEELENCGLVFLTNMIIAGTPNRVVKALRAGKFVITPYLLPGWEVMRDFVFVGELADGVEWVRKHSDEALDMIRAGQDYIRYRYSPETIGHQWREFFLSVT